MKNRLRAVRHIAAQDLRDLFRERGTWLLLATFPIVNVVLMVALPGIISQREYEQRSKATFTVAAKAAPADIETLRDLLRPARLRVVASPDPGAAVKGKDAHAGIVVPEGSTLPAAASAVGSGEVQLQVVALTSRAASRTAMARAVSTLEAYRAQLTADGVAARGLPPRVARPIVVEAVDLATTDQGGRLTLSGALPFVMLLPLASALSLAGQRISGGKDKRVMEPLLLLPVPRSIVLLGKALSGYAIGIIILPAIALPLLAGRVVPVAEAGRKVSLPPGTVLAVVAIAAAVLALFVALGSCLGALSRSNEEMGALVPIVTVPVMLLGFVFGYVQVRTTTLLAVVPVVGPTLVARDIVAGTSGVVDIATTMVATVALAVALVAVSGRLLERERSVVRATS